MKVKDLMSTPVAVCTPETDIATAAVEMLDNDCGVLPVLDAKAHLVGVITDRDICMAAATRPTRAWEIPVGSVISSTIISIGPEDSVQEAMKVMKEERVRRLPVAEFDGSLLGIISINDVIRAAEKPGKKGGDGPHYEEVIDTLKAIHKPWTVSDFVKEVPVQGPAPAESESVPA